MPKKSRDRRAQRLKKAAKETLAEIQNNGPHARAAIMYWRQRLAAGVDTVQDAEKVRRFLRDKIGDGQATDRIKMTVARELNRMAEALDAVAQQLDASEREVLFTPPGKGVGDGEVVGDGAVSTGGVTINLYPSKK